MWGWPPRRPMTRASRRMRSTPVSSRPSVLISEKATSRSSGGVVDEVDALLAALAEEALDGVAAGGERGRLGGSRSSGWRRWRAAGRRDRRAALAAEARVRRQCHPATGANDLQPRPAGEAELGAFRVGVAAGWTLHGRSGGRRCCDVSWTDSYWIVGCCWAGVNKRIADIETHAAAYPGRSACRASQSARVSAYSTE